MANYFFHSFHDCFTGTGESFNNFCSASEYDVTTEKKVHRMYIYGIYRFYEDIHGSMLRLRQCYKGSSVLQTPRTTTNITYQWLICHSIPGSSNQFCMLAWVYSCNKHNVLLIYLWLPTSNSTMPNYSTYQVLFKRCVLCFVLMCYGASKWYPFSSESLN